MYSIRHRNVPEPWDVLDRVQAEFERMGAALENTQSPAIDVWSEGDDLRLRALLPGVQPEQLEISVEGDALTLRGTRAEPGAGADDRWIRKERASGAFVRWLQLPFEVQADSVKARLANGVLEMELPRAETAKPRRILVQQS
jgi:HSP20 family protein